VEARLAFYLPDPDRVRATPRARLVAAERGVDLSEIAGSGPDGAVLVSDVEAWLRALEQEAAPALPGDVPATPVAARMAAELGVDLARVSPSGPGGRVTKRDLRDFLEREKREAPARERALHGDEIRLSQKRKFLTRQMVESKQTTPHFYLSMEIDAAPLRALLEREKAQGRRITWTHGIVKAAALALEAFPDVNATFRDDRILRFNPINVAVATAVGDELVAPVVRDCQARSLESIAAATDALIAKAREKKLAPEDYSDGTFTISNLGMFGIDHFYAIITPPQASVLSVSRVRTEPVVVDGEIRIGQRMTFGLACDHRVLDGARGAQFLAELKRIAEHPEELLGRSSDGE
jgi:pyruvate dehydrogenase E2 component (dihydrolipoamide acetyltransferase)